MTLYVLAISLITITTRSRRSKTQTPSTPSDHAETEPGGFCSRPAHPEMITRGSHQPEDTVVVLP